MAITFNADEVFEMAEEIERNGARFYRQAAQNTTDKNMRKFLLDMAAMEDKHLETFHQMRESLSGPEKDQPTFDPDSEAALYLQAMADTHGYEGKVSPSEPLTGRETAQQVLEIALNSEKESVVYYFGLRSLVPEKAGKDKVEAVIHEELGHIATIHNYLMELKQTGEKK